MWGKRRQEAQPEISPDADVQKFFASMAPEPAKEAQPEAAAAMLTNLAESSLNPSQAHLR